VWGQTGRRTLPSSCLGSDRCVGRDEPGQAARQPRFPSQGCFHAGNDRSGSSCFPRARYRASPSAGTRQRWVLCGRCGTGRAGGRRRAPTRRSHGQPHRGLRPGAAPGARLSNPPVLPATQGLQKSPGSLPELSARLSGTARLAEGTWPCTHRGTWPYPLHEGNQSPVTADKALINDVAWALCSSWLSSTVLSKAAVDQGDAKLHLQGGVW